MFAQASQGDNEVYGYDHASTDGGQNNQPTFLVSNSSSGDHDYTATLHLNNVDRSTHQSRRPDSVHESKHNTTGDGSNLHLDQSILKETRKSNIVFIPKISHNINIKTYRPMAMTAKQVR